MMKHVNNVAPLDGVGDRFAPVHWNAWYGSGQATSESGKTCKTFAYSSSQSRYFFLGSLRGCPTMFRAPMSRGCLETEQK